MWVDSFGRFAQRFHLESVYRVIILGKVSDPTFFAGILPTLPSILNQGFIGRLGIKIEPAGKVRVFAMVDAFSQ